MDTSYFFVSVLILCALGFKNLTAVVKKKQTIHMLAYKYMHWLFYLKKNFQYYTNENAFV